MAALGFTTTGRYRLLEVEGLAGTRLALEDEVQPGPTGERDAVVRAHRCGRAHRRSTPGLARRLVPARRAAHVPGALDLSRSRPRGRAETGTLGWPRRAGLRACWSRCRRMSRARATADRGAGSRGPSSSPSRGSIGGIARTGSASCSRARTFRRSAWVRVPRAIESSHFLIMGDSGTGKSALIRQMLTQIEARGETAIVYDPALEYTPQFYTPERGDAILNPLDARSPYWTPADEWRHEAETLTLATSLFPDRHHENAFFTEAPRRIFAHLLTLRPTPEQLAWWLCHEDEIDRRLAGTAYAAMIDRQAPAQRSGVLASLNMVADTLKLLPAGAGHVAPLERRGLGERVAPRVALPHQHAGNAPAPRAAHEPVAGHVGAAADESRAAAPASDVVRARRTRQPAAAAAAPHGHHGKPEIEQSRGARASKGAASSRRATATTPRRCCRSRPPRSSSAPVSRTRRSGSRTPSGTSRSNGCGRADPAPEAGSRATDSSARSSRW